MCKGDTNKLVIKLKKNKKKTCWRICAQEQFHFVQSANFHECQKAYRWVCIIRIYLKRFLLSCGPPAIWRNNSWSKYFSHILRLVNNLKNVRVGLHIIGFIYHLRVELPKGYIELEKIAWMVAHENLRKNHLKNIVAFYEIMFEDHNISENLETPRILKKHWGRGQIFYYYENRGELSSTPSKT